MLVVRELVCGSQQFNDLRRGLPRMSPTLLSKRLQRLVREGIIERRSEKGAVHYLLTPAGQELQPIVEALGVWGTRWIAELGDIDLDPRLLMWDIHRNVDLDAVPPGRTVIQFEFVEPGARKHCRWLVIADDGVGVCDTDPGHPVTVTITTTLRQMVEIWRGDTTWAAAVRSGSLEMRGSAEHRNALPGWLKLSDFAPVPRP